MAAQGHGAFAATDKTGDIFDELIQETNKSAAKTFFERGTNTSIQANRLLNQCCR